MMNVEDCFVQGLLKKDKPDKGKALRSIDMALKKAAKSEKLLKSDFLEEAVVSAYSAMFHAARSILFKEGIKERSHYAVYVYLKEKYSQRIERKFLVQFDYLRQERHDVVYSLEESKLQASEVKDAIEMAKKFIENLKKLI